MLFHLLVFLYFLLRADGAVLLPLLIGSPEIVLGHPAMENPNAVHTHEQHDVRHQLRGRCKSKYLALFLILKTYLKPSCRNESVTCQFFLTEKKIEI